MKVIGSSGQKNKQLPSRKDYKSACTTFAFSYSVNAAKSLNLELEEKMSSDELAAKQVEIMNAVYGRIYRDEAKVEDLDQGRKILEDHLKNYPYPQCIEVFDLFVSKVRGDGQE